MRVAPSSVRTYMYAVQSLHVDSGFRTFMSSSPRLQRALKGIEHASPASDRPRRLPITPEILSRLLQQSLTEPNGPHDSLLLATTFSTAFFGFLHAGKICATRSPADPTRLFLRRDLSFHESPATPPFARLRLKASKTDQAWSGVDVDLPHVDDPVCAHCALRRLVDAFAHCPGDFLFCHGDGRPLHRSAFSAALVSWLVAAKVPAAQHLQPHSFRIGAATAAAEAGMPAYAIQLLGRWKSDAFLVYIRTPPESILRLRSSIWPASGPAAAALAGAGLELAPQAASTSQRRRAAGARAR
eukprot:tig00020531_g10020.t1